MNIIGYRTDVERDELSGSPWSNEDGHGAVSEWTTRDKEPGELVLCSIGSQKLFYDFKGACKTARKNGWGYQNMPENETPKQRAANAALSDFKRLRAWCNGEWNYVTVTVTEIRQDADDFKYDGESESLGGIESDCEEYIEEVIQELIEELKA